MSTAKPHYEVPWTETARTDLEELARFIAHDSVKNALAVLERLEHAAEKLAYLPERGRYVPELKHLGVLAYLEIIVRPWRSSTGLMSIVFIVGVLDGRRDLAALLLERLIR